uniref:C-type cytochrome n=1 Tax=Eiseniibacteriota bacterium TaxID=2212470 RepID=A0A832I218_UNCEI
MTIRSAAALLAAALAAAGCRDHARLAPLVEGQRVYHGQCAVCHGDYGRGDGPLAARLVEDGGAAPADLTDPARIAALGRGGLRRSLGSSGAHRRPASAMPVWGPHLGERLAGRAADFVATLPALGPDARDAVDAYLGAGARGRREYVLFCSGCHGPYGAGDGLFSPALARDLRPADLTDSARFAALDDEALRGLIALGGGHAELAPTMPGWINTLEPEQIEAIAGYVRVLSRTARR